MQQKLRNFFKAVQDLRESNIIRSDRYLGDIGEKICEVLYGIELNPSAREEGHDGVLNNEKYEIKFHNSPTRTNIYLGNPEKYNILLVVLGPHSLLRPDGHEESFLIYKITNEYVIENFKQESGYCCGKGYFAASEIDNTYSI